MSAIGVVLDDTTTPTLASVVSSAVKAIANELNGAANILKIKSDKLGAASPSLAALLEGIVSKTFGDLSQLTTSKSLDLRLRAMLFQATTLFLLLIPFLQRQVLNLTTLIGTSLARQQLLLKHLYTYSIMLLNL